jgi:hypothetical protein
MRTFVAVTKKESPRAPVVSEGTAPSRSVRASNPKTCTGARGLGCNEVVDASAIRPRLENTSKDVGRSCTGPAGPEWTTERAAYRFLGADSRPFAAGAASSIAPRPKTDMTASSRRNVLTEMAST